MSDDTEKTPNTAIDNTVDQQIKEPVIAKETYKLGESDAPVARTPRPESSAAKIPHRSWTMTEIERAIDQQVIPLRNVKLDQFALQMQRRTDVRLRNFVRRLDPLIARDFSKDIKAGPKAQRLRPYDIRAHSIRLVAANAALGSYQFQRSQTLPYMRKNLALGYAKVNLLKLMVAGITSLEKAVVSKLEAIKLNTAAVAPEKKSFFQELRDGVRAKQKERIIGNVSDFLLKRKSATFNKTVSPALAFVHRKMADPSQHGGINGVARAVRRKINSIRRTAVQHAKVDPAASTAFGRLKGKVAGTAAGILGGVVRTGQRVQPLSEGKNRIIGNALKGWTSQIQAFNPYAKDGKFDDSAPKDDAVKPTDLGSTANSTDAPKPSALDRLTGLFSEWRTEYRQDNDAIISHLKAIETCACPKRSRRTTPKPNAPTSDGRVSAPRVRPGYVERVQRTAAKTARLAGDRRQRPRTQTKPSPAAAVSKTTASTLRDQFKQFMIEQQRSTQQNRTATKTSLGQSVRAMVQRSTAGARSTLGAVKTTMTKTKPVLATVRQMVAKPATTISAAAVPVAAKLWEKVSSVKSTIADSATKPSTASLLSVLTTKLSDITAAIAKGNRSEAAADAVSEKRQSLKDKLTAKSEKLRDKYENFMMSRQSMMDKLTAKATRRKNSYEDILEQKTGKLRLPGWAKTLDVAGAAGRGAEAGVEAVTAGNAASASLAARFGIPTLGTMIGGAAGFAVKNAVKFGVKGTKVAAQAGFKGTKYAAPKAVKFGFKAARGLTRFGIKTGTDAAKVFGKTLLQSGKAVGGAAGKTATGLLGKAGRGLFSLAKGPAGLGLAAGIGNHFLQKSGASDGVKRAGGTALSVVEYGAMGAQIGALFGGIGAVPGAAVGAAIGGVIANADYAAKALHGVGNFMSGGIKAGESTWQKFKHSGDVMWDSLVGKDAVVRPDGTVISQQRDSLLQSITHSFFGSKARYSSSGDVIAPEQLSLVGKVQYGFQKLLFGDKFSNGEYKEGTSLIAMAYQGVGKAITNFGKRLRQLPDDIAKGFSQFKSSVADAAAKTKTKIVNAAKATRDAVIAAPAKGLKILRDKQKELAKAKYDMSWKGVKSFASDTMGKVLSSAYMVTPAAFSMGASSAAFGWTLDSGAINNPTSPCYGFVTQVLNAYGIKDRSQYRFVHALEVSQDKINTGQTKPFDDNDMAYMAQRFGYDTKNKEQVNYFKLWYKRRFLAMMAIIGRVLRAHKLSFGSALSADEKQMAAVTADLQRELSATTDSSIRSLDLTPQAYNRFAKIGNADPGGTGPRSMDKSKPYDPRDPRNRSNYVKTANDNAWSGDPNFAPNTNFGNRYEEQAAERRSAKLGKGGVKDQPEFKAAYQKLPDYLKKLVDKSKSLQFVLWSTSVQHGPDVASKIFQRDYSDKLDEKGFIRSIYQDRSTRFSNLNGRDRSEAMGHIGEEERYALGIQDGSNSPDIGSMAREISNVISPDGNSQLAYDQSSYTAKPLTGSLATRAKDAVNYLMAKRYSKAGAIAMVASLIGESNLDYTNQTGDRGQAHGIAQWHPPRRNGIYKRFGKPVEAMNLHEQLDAVDWEVNGGNGEGRNGLAETLATSQDIPSAVRAVVYDYERPADKPGDTLKRTLTAMNLQKTFGGMGGVQNDRQSLAPAGRGGAGAQARSPAKPTASAPAKASAPPAKPAIPAMLKAPGTTPTIEQNTANHSALDNHAKALHANTAALKAHQETIKGNPAHHNTTVIPINAGTTSHQNHAMTGQRNFVAVSLKKIAVTAGDH